MLCEQPVNSLLMWHSTQKCCCIHIPHQSQAAQVQILHLHGFHQSAPIPQTRDYSLLFSSSENWLSNHVGFFLSGKNLALVLVRSPIQCNLWFLLAVEWSLISFPWPFNNILPTWFLICYKPSSKVYRLILAVSVQCSLTNGMAYHSVTTSKEEEEVYVAAHTAEWNRM